MSAVEKVGVRLGFNRWQDVIYADNLDINRDTVKSEALCALYDKYPEARKLSLYPAVLASTDSDRELRQFMYAPRDRIPGMDYVCFHAWRLKRNRRTIAFSIRGVIEFDSPGWEDIPALDARRMWPQLTRGQRMTKLEDTQRVPFDKLIQGENRLVKVFCR